jgi:hypothetical protein
MIRLTLQLYAASSSPRKFPIQLPLDLLEELFQSNHLSPTLHAIHEDTYQTHHAVPNTPEIDLSKIIHHLQQSELTSGKLAQILLIASRTSNCVSENPLVSINVFARHGRDTENCLD